VKRWLVTYRAKKSAYVRGLEKRRGLAIKSKPTTVTFSGTNVGTRAAALKAFKKLYPWVVILSFRRVK